MNNIVSEDEALENAIKISTMPHRLYESDFKAREYWADSFIPQRVIYHYLPLTKKYSLSVMIHEINHITENADSIFYFLSFTKDLINDMFRYEVINEQVSPQGIRLKVNEIDQILNNEWKYLTEASAYIDQVSSFLTPDILEDAIIDNLERNEPIIFFQGSKLLMITNNILNRMGILSQLSYSELINWQATKVLFENDWEIGRTLKLTDYEFNETSMNVKIVERMIRKTVIHVIYDVTASVWKTGKYPPVNKALNQLFKLSPQDIPEWHSFSQLYDFLKNEIRTSLDIEISYFPGPYILFSNVLNILQSDTLDEVLKKYMYGVLVYISQLISEEGDHRYLFPSIFYTCPIRNHFKEQKILSCSFLAKPNRDMGKTVSADPIPKDDIPIFEIMTKALRDMLVIRNNVFKNCSKHCIGKRDCPKREIYFKELKNAWKPLYTNELEQMFQVFVQSMMDDED